MKSPQKYLFGCFPSETDIEPVSCDFEPYLGDVAPRIDFADQRPRREYLQRLENGERPWSYRLRAMSHVLGVPIKELMG
jgi:hypothetical protein